MNERLLDPEVQEYLLANEGVDPASVALKGDIFPGVSSRELAQQMDSRRRSKNKLPSWYGTPGIYFPPKLNIEQTSSERTAAYKASLVSGNTGIDLSGGLGVDTYYLSQKHRNFTYCERDENLFPVAKHNFKALDAMNINCISGDGIEYLRSSQEKYDTIFVDPSRRSDLKGKVFRLEDCSPDMTTHIDLLLSRTDLLLVKTSPLLDIQLGLQQLEQVASIHVLAIENEVKELLWECKPGYTGMVMVRTRNWNKTGLESFDFQLEMEKDCVPGYAHPQQYLYEPNSAVMKSGAFCLVGNEFELSKIAAHSHLYTADKRIDFPGRCFKVLRTLDFSKKSMKQLGISKANISTRNFPLTVAQLRKRFKISDGGQDYLFFTTTAAADKIVIHCRK